MGKLSWTTKISFGMGAFGKDLVYAIVATFLMIYLTDVRMVSPAFVGTLFLVARVWDAFNDPVMGMIVDNTRSRFGRFRPWIVIGTLINAVILYMLYADYQLSPSSYKIYIAVFYILWGMTYTIMDIPYWSMVPALTSDRNEREQIAAIPRLFASFAWLLIGTFGLGLVAYLGGGNDALGFERFALAVCIAFIVTILIMAANTRENVVPPEQLKTTSRRLIKVLVKNDQVLVILGIALLFNVAFQLSNGFALYYFKYVTNQETLYSTYAAVAGLSQMGALACFPKTVRAIGRGRAYALSCLLPVLGFILLLVFGYVSPRNVVLVGLASAVVNVGIGFMLALITVMLADVVDYGEYKLESRNESIIFSTQTFVVKLAGALSGFVSGIGLTLIGYVPNVAQSPGAILGMRIIMIVLPAVLSILCLVVYRKSYRLTGRFQEEIMEELRVRSSRVMRKTDS